jgi:hypothetical protein
VQHNPTCCLNLVSNASDPAKSTFNRFHCNSSDSECCFVFIIYFLLFIDIRSSIPIGFTALTNVERVAIDGHPTSTSGLEFTHSTGMGISIV